MSTAAQIALHTAAAYSADRFGDAEWELCAALLLNNGLNAEQAAAFLRSKHLRWAANMNGATASGLATYISSRRNLRNGLRFEAQQMLEEEMF